MKVFISWSGRRSEIVAQALHDWLKDVVQVVDPWISSEDIRKGRRWSAELAQGLESTHVGVVCLTPENLTKPWILFEAGALSKLHKDAYVCTYLIGVDASTVTGPLAEFQHTLATKEHTHQLVKTINAAIAEQPGRLTEAQLERAFERCWPDLQRCLDTLPKPEEPEALPRTDKDMLQEVLEIVRDLAKVLPHLTLSPAPSVFKRLGEFIARTRTSSEDISAQERTQINQEIAQLLQELKEMGEDLASSQQTILGSIPEERRAKLEKLLSSFTMPSIPSLLKSEKPIIPERPSTPRRNKPTRKGRHTSQGKPRA